MSDERIQAQVPQATPPSGHAPARNPFSLFDFVKFCFGSALFVGLSLALALETHLVAPALAVATALACGVGLGVLLLIARRLTSAQSQEARSLGRMLGGLAIAVFFVGVIACIYWAHSYKHTPTPRPDGTIPIFQEDTTPPWQPPRLPSFG
jgi:hypothetical protein